MTRGRYGSINDIKEFWEAESCGERYFDEHRSYTAIDTERYRREPHIRSFGKFDERFAGVGLEIGLGTASDFVQNTARGGSWIGLDLTDRVLEHAKRRVGYGAVYIQGDAEMVPIRSSSVDHVYSWGVLLCCPDMQAAVDEVYRILVPGGTATIMLYHLQSWVTVAAWLRWGAWRAVGPRKAVSYMESPGTHIVTKREARNLFSRFQVVKLASVNTYWDRRWLGPIGRLFGNRMGWHLVCQLVK